MEDGQRQMVGEEESRITTQGVNKSLDEKMIVVGICAMAKKTNSKPMKEILARLNKFEHLQIIVFDEAMILNDPVDTWPVVDALVSFFSNGFPLQKAIEYKNLRRPYVVNDLEAQYVLFDRREVYKILVREGIAHPRYAVMNRDKTEDPPDMFEENEDAIEVNGVAFQRPFVEKPVCAEDHNIYIYFPVSAGGGCQRLFRKVGSRSSVYSTINRVRKTGSYVYEDFMPTDGTDVKVYTVGPDYAHAEARKSPALDGKVDRDKDGKEIRYPVLLSASEKMTARRVCIAFKQNVCGFDLLRANGKSYVCDVNGFSFVKNSTKYYDDCANVLGTMIVRALAPQLHIPLVLGAAPEDIPVVHTTSGSMMELRCVVAVIRHGDRTPKQKMKMEVKNRKFFELFEKYGGYKTGHLKLKKPKQLQEILDIARDLLTESEKARDLNPEVQEKKAKLRQLKLVLEMYEFTGINRKIQLKYQPFGRPPESSEDEFPREPSLVLIVKWGGELTPAGKFQAEDLGKAFRTLYPGGQGEFETPGLGFLRLHSTFRHDLKIYASDEGRVQMTAAAFTKGLLALEGELTPILVSMVKSANTNGLLDKEGETSKYQHVVKEKLMEILNEDREFTEADTEKLNPTGSCSLLNAMKFIENPRKLCDRVFDMVREITSQIKMLKLELKSRDLKLYHGESWELLIRRWAKLEKDFKLKSGNYDISKIPDIYDCIKYDLQHNQKTLQYERAEELFMCSKALADIVIPQEYGINLEEKLHISQSICSPLMRKIHSDLVQVCQHNVEEESTRLNSKYSKGVASPERFVRTRLYFTSESHIHSLLNMFRFGGLFDPTRDEQWKKAVDFLSATAELNYMTQINIMMFEDPSKEFTSPERFHVELHFSPGAYTSCDTDVMNPVSSGYRTIFHSRQPKKPDNGHKHLENAKKEGIIHEECIDEIGSQEELFNSKDSDNSPCVYRVHIHEVETGVSHLGQRSVDKPLILIDKVMKSDIGLAPSDKDAVTHIDNKDVNTTTATAVQDENIKSDTGMISKDDTAVVDVDNCITGSKLATTSKESITATVSQEPLTEVNTESEKKLESDNIETNNKTSGQKKTDDTSSENLNSSVKETAALEKVEKKTNPSNDVKRKSEETKSEKSAEKQNETDTKLKKKNSVTFNMEKSESEKILQQGTVNENVDESADVLGNLGDNNTKTDKEGSEEDVLGRKVFTVGSEDNLDELVESLHNSDKMFELQDEDLRSEESRQELSPQGSERVPEPKSPDPDIPEWDWGDNSKSQEKGREPDKAAISSQNERKLSETKSESTPLLSALDLQPLSPTKSISSSPSPAAVSRPLTIEVWPADRRRTGSFDNLKTYEEGRSRSLEDKVDDGIALMEKHYLTIHLPINKDRHHHSFSSLLYLNPEAFRDESLALPQQLLVSYSAPDLSVSLDAFDGFNMVPSLKPLETLHNNLTLKQMDAYFKQATTTKFFTPVSSPLYGTTPMVSPRLPESKRHKSGSGQSLASTQSLPSSANSSAGPSSPASVSTPVDFFSKLKMFMLDTQIDGNQYSDREVQVTSEGDLPSLSSSASDISSKSGVPCGSSNSDVPSSSSSVLKVKESSPKESIVNKVGTVPKDTDNIQEVQVKKTDQNDANSKGKGTSPDDSQKTLTGKSPQAFKCLKPQSEHSGNNEDCKNLAADFENKVCISGVPKSPTNLSQQIPPDLTETLKIDMNQETHVSAFKKVGKRFKMTHVPEESLNLTQPGRDVSSGTNKNTNQNVNDIAISNDATSALATVDKAVDEGKLV